MTINTKNGGCGHCVLVVRYHFFLLEKNLTEALKDQFSAIKTDGWECSRQISSTWFVASIQDIHNHEMSLFFPKTTCKKYFGILFSVNWLLSTDMVGLCFSVVLF